MLLLDYKKICKKCKELKSIHLFEKDKRRSDLHGSYCKICSNELHKTNSLKCIEKYKCQSRKRTNKYRFSTKGKEKIRLYKSNNKENLKRMQKASIEKRKQFYKNINKKYYQNNKSHIIKRCVTNTRLRKINNPYFKFVTRIRSNFNTKVRAFKLHKPNINFEILGCTFEKLFEHLQNTALNNEYFDFNINNYNGKEYHIDHIVPCAVFNLKCTYHQKLCFHYTNLQILKADENRSKYKKITEKQLEAMIK